MATSGFGKGTDLIGPISLAASVQRKCSNSHTQNLLELRFDSGFLTLKVWLFFFNHYVLGGPYYCEKVAMCGRLETLKIWV
jgi:hypothetical protein